LIIIINSRKNPQKIHKRNHATRGIHHIHQLHEPTIPYLIPKQTLHISRDKNSPITQVGNPNRRRKINNQSAALLLLPTSIQQKIKSSTTQSAPFQFPIFTKWTK
jgi:hypothetical protein